MRARALYGIVVVVRIATLVWAWLNLPEQIATHFGASGAPDGWGSRSGYLAVDILISAALILGFPMLVGLLSRGSGAGVNIPHKEYWFRPENRPGFRRRMTTDMLFIGGATGLLLSWIDVEIVRANALATPVMGASSWVAVSVFMVAVVGYSIWMATGRYAIPRGQRAGSRV
jgi:uncharacterized membrane protein